MDAASSYEMPGRIFQSFINGSAIHIPNEMNEVATNA